MYRMQKCGMFCHNLIRRAEENTSVAGQTSRELRMLKAELDRRKSGPCIFDRIRTLSVTILSREK